MNILLISYGIKEYDGRLIEIYDVAKKMGNTTLVCVGEKEGRKTEEKIVKLNNNKYLSFKVYFTFLFLCLRTSKSMKDIDVLFVDNLFASIPGLLIKWLYKPKRVVQDVRELYFYKDIKSRAGKLFCKYEVNLMKKADVVLSANEHRSKIMYKTYNLTKKPIVFENVRFLTGEFDKSLLDEKYKGVFTPRIKIISTGGLSVLRTTDKLVMAMKELPEDYGLFLIGGGSDEDITTINKIIHRYNLNNVHFIDKVPLAELRYIVQQCDIGIVNYHKNDLNNKYCASGKVYEYLAEGLPIVTTENIPLKEFCDKYGVGEADDEFYKGIKKVSTNIDEYKERVGVFISKISVDSYNSKIANEIQETLNSKEVNIV